MAKYIDKSAVVAEIERLKHKLLDHVIYESDKEWAIRTAHQLNRIIWFINDIEVEEVDLDKEARHYLLYEHESPLFRILHEIDLLIEMQYHKDIENAFKAGCELGIRGRAIKTSEFLKKHFEETPQEELDKEWNEIVPLNNIGPDVLEYANKKNNETK